MDFSAPSPASSSSTSYSPRLMSSDLGLDPSDPLNLLLHNSSQSHSGNSSMEESSQEGGSPPDWSELSSLWPDNDFSAQSKPYSDMMDFSELASLSMDVDFSNAIAVEPSALHFDSMKFSTINTNYSYNPHTPSYTDDLLAAQFPFTFQPHHDPNSTSDLPSHLSSQGTRRLSITSSVSSSGASLSPAPESMPSPVTATQTEFTSNHPSSSENFASTSPDPATELAERVRQSSGVMLALPMCAQLQALEKQQAANTPPATSPASIPKLPIPRLPRPASQSVKSTSPSTTSSAASTPPPSTPSPPPISAVATPSISSAPLPRPKTSHTTIERRYRTNLNARIQSLRMAVPALRVVEDREGGKKRAPNKVLVSSDPLKLEGGVTGGIGGVDVIDERGFVDGVKVARKCSKANVLGKAVEYIRVLKKREMRLKAEQAGLKVLVSGLVGGPALLREWEREWREMFGGEEKDEVEGEMDADAEEDDSEEEGEDEDEAGRKRKRGKTTASGGPGASSAAKQDKKEKKPVTGADGAVPEKRKRGRPRKVVPPVASAAPPIATQDQKMEMQQGHGPQQYLLATFALFSFYNSPLTSSSTSPHAHTGTVLSGSAATVQGSDGWGLSKYIQMFHLLVSVVVLLSFVSSWIGFSFNFGKSQRSGSVLNLAVRGRREKRAAIDWVRLGEECVLSSNNKTRNVPLLSRLQVYYNITSWSGAGPQELTTAALTLYGTGGVLGGLARIKARAVWSKVKTKARATHVSGLSAHERMVLEEMTLDAAAARLADVEGEKGQGQTPMQVLADALVRERIRAHLGVLFIGSVSERAGDEVEPDKEVLELENVERQKTVEAAKELGGRVGELGRRLERVWKVTVDSAAEEMGDEGREGEAEALLAALVLYRRVFSSLGNGNGASGLMSPPPSPGRKDTTDAGRLRRALGSRVFEESAALEDARDRAVDMVVALERRSVGLD
ncbi:hypothetical protein D9615_005063 [Tricholomella constricta]|uniref:BHLH domain-containing protein n=1 Tax=Tricholomella constricta TaxID=117010 RepID=A0A8H5HHE2_9AGAR|nr:hypothetical protein D9615_005063 [Tricholomella constricta]